MNPVEDYLRELRDIHSSGAAVDETSGYNALARLLSEIGRTLKPRVRCIIGLKNLGAGMPDGGLFTPDQFQRASDAKPLPGQVPARGAIEVKPPAQDVGQVVASDQVAKYVEHYGLVLVTNYREFVLVGRNAGGKAVPLESHRLAASETEFWGMAAHPRRTAEEHGLRLIDYLKRAMLHKAPLMAPRDVAWFLASYAREARARLEEQANLPALAAVRAALEESLGLKFEGAKGEHFFRATLVQTLFYGIFAAWVLYHSENADPRYPFDWRVAPYSLHVPVIQALFEQVSAPSKLKPLGLMEVLNWTAAALNRVDRDAFFAGFEQGKAVQYFYEPFLEAYDPELRRDLGVWYTPPEIVQYMVARVDAVLRQELGVQDGLADPQVYVLDACCGTGAYLVEVLKRIATTLRERNGDALVGEDLKRAAMKRVLGFEILPAPFVIAHLQLGLLLQSLGAPLSTEQMERAGVYLTNALTNWGPAAAGHGEVQATLAGMPELQQEHDAAQNIKQDVPILVVLGNPPYNAFAGVSPAEEQGLVEPYKKGLIAEWGIKKFNLDDLYIRFFRLAERRIAEMTGRGVVCFISNHSWISDPSFVVLRQHLLASFDRFWIENLHGNRKISEYAPDGRTSETIFAIPGFSAGIQQGVAISLWAKGVKELEGPRVAFRDDLDAAKAVERRAQLLQSLEDEDAYAHYQPATPAASNRYSFRPMHASSDYLSWPGIEELCEAPPINGLMEKRGSALIDIDKASLEKRMRMYYDPTVDWETLKVVGKGLTQNAAGFEARKVRGRVQAREQYQANRVARYGLRPFDTRWCYYSDVSPLWNRSRPTLWAQCWEGNCFLLSRVAAAKDPEGPPFHFVTGLFDDHLLAPDASCFPLRLRSDPVKSAAQESTTLFMLENQPKANLSPVMRMVLTQLGVTELDNNPEAAGLVWMHALAIGYSPAYLSENADGIRQDWPRIPLPASREQLLASAALGRQVAALLNTEQPMPGVTAGALRPELKTIGAIRRVGGGSLKVDGGDLEITAGWGHAGRDGVTMPGHGRLVERNYTAEERAALAQGAGLLGLSLEQALQHLGESTFDIYLNDVAYWANVPSRVWGYVIGGYQVMKKWLSYRERDLLGRSLTADEAREVTAMARRIAAIVLLEPALDANYAAVKAATYSWPTRA